MFVRLCPGSSVVEYLARYPEIEGSSPPSGIRREERLEAKRFKSKCPAAVELLVESLTHNLNIEGSDPTNGTGREKERGKRVKKVL